MIQEKQWVLIVLLSLGMLDCGCSKSTVPYKEAQKWMTNTTCKTHTSELLEPVQNCIYPSEGIEGPSQRIESFSKMARQGDKNALEVLVRMLSEYEDEEIIVTISDTLTDLVAGAEEEHLSLVWIMDNNLLGEKYGKIAQLYWKDYWDNNQGNLYYHWCVLGRGIWCELGDPHPCMYCELLKFLLRRLMPSCPST